MRSGGRDGNVLSVGGLGIAGFRRCLDSLNFHSRRKERETFCSQRQEPVLVFVESNFGGLTVDPLHSIEIERAKGGKELFARQDSH